MARTAAVLPGGTRLSDYLSVGVIAQVFPLSAVRAALDETGRRSRRQRALPAEVMIYYVITMALFRSVAAREVLRCLVDGLRWLAPSMPVRVSGKSSISRARSRLGTATVRGVVPCAGGSGSGTRDAGCVVPWPAPGSVRWIDAGRTGRSREPRHLRVAGHWPGPSGVSAGTSDRDGGSGHAGGLCVASGTVARFGGRASGSVAQPFTGRDAGTGGSELLRIPAVGCGHCRPAPTCCGG